MAIFATVVKFTAVKIFAMKFFPLLVVREYVNY